MFGSLHAELPAEGLWGGVAGGMTSGWGKAIFNTIPNIDYYICNIGYLISKVSSIHLLMNYKGQAINKDRH